MILSASTVHLGYWTGLHLGVPPTAGPPVGAKGFPFSTRTRTKNPPSTAHARPPPTTCRSSTRFAITIHQQQTTVATTSCGPFELKQSFCSTSNKPRKHVGCPRLPETKQLSSQELANRALRRFHHQSSCRRIANRNDFKLPFE